MENEIESLFDLRGLKAFKENEGKHIETEEGVKIPRTADMHRLVELAKLSSRKNIVNQKTDGEHTEEKAVTRPNKELGSVLAGLAAKVSLSKVNNDVDEPKVEKPEKKTTKKTTTTKKSTTTKKTAKKTTSKTTTKSKKKTTETLDNDKLNKTSYKELASRKLKEFEDMLEVKDSDEIEMNSISNEIETSELEKDKVDSLSKEKEEVSEEKLNEFIDKVVEDIHNNKFIKEFNEKVLEDIENKVEKSETIKDDKSKENTIEHEKDDNKGLVLDDKIEDVANDQLVSFGKKNKDDKENEKMEKNLNTQANYNLKDYIKPAIEEAKKAQLLVEELDDNEIVINSKSYDFF